jgi:hypothetical protein
VVTAVADSTESSNADTIPARKRPVNFSNSVEAKLKKQAELIKSLQAENEQLVESRMSRTPVPSSSTSSNQRFELLLAVEKKTNEMLITQQEREDKIRTEALLLLERDQLQLEKQRKKEEELELKLAEQARLQSAMNLKLYQDRLEIEKLERKRQEERDATKHAEQIALLRELSEEKQKREDELLAKKNAAIELILRDQTSERIAAAIEREKMNERAEERIAREAFREEKRLEREAAERQQQLLLEIEKARLQGIEKKGIIKNERVRQKREAEEASDRLEMARIDKANGMEDKNADRDAYLKMTNTAFRSMAKFAKRR